MRALLFSFSTVEPKERWATTRRPEARTSGLATPCLVGPTEDQLTVSSSERLAVPLSLKPPTVRTMGSSAGFMMVPALGPLLPAATTTVMPCFHSRCTA